MIPSTNSILYLSREGDSVEIKNVDHNKVSLQLEAASCKTHAQVLAFLERIKLSESVQTLTFYHTHNTSYDLHWGTYPKGAAHPCELDEQIRFVKYKILESEEGVRLPPQKLGCNIF